MHTRMTVLSMMLVLAAALAPATHADEEATARVREMLRRTQEALHQAQADNAELTRAKADAEQKLQATTKDLEAARGVSKAEVALRGELQTTKAAQEDLAHQLRDANTALAAANRKQIETLKQLAAREAELAQVKQGLEQSRIANASCEAKNLKLYSYAQEVLQAYKKKGVWAALAQKDPVLGLKDVDVENVVQEYQVKFASQKVKPAPP